MEPYVLIFFAIYCSLFSIASNSENGFTPEMLTQLLNFLDKTDGKSSHLDFYNINRHSQKNNLHPQPQYYHHYHHHNYGPIGYSQFNPMQSGFGSHRVTSNEKSQSPVQNQLLGIEKSRSSKMELEGVPSEEEPNQNYKGHYKEKHRKHRNKNSDANPVSELISNQFSNYTVPDDYRQQHKHHSKHRKLKNNIFDKKDKKQSQVPLLESQTGSSDKMNLLIVDPAKDEKSPNVTKGAIQEKFPISIDIQDLGKIPSFIHLPNDVQLPSSSNGFVDTKLINFHITVPIVTSYNVQPKPDESHKVLEYFKLIKTLFPSTPLKETQSISSVENKFPYNNHHKSYQIPFQVKKQISQTSEEDESTEGMPIKYPLHTSTQRRLKPLYISSFENVPFYDAYDSQEYDPYDVHPMSDKTILSMASQFLESNSFQNFESLENGGQFSFEPVYYPSFPKDQNYNYHTKRAKMLYKTKKISNEVSSLATCPEIKSSIRGCAKCNSDVSCGYNEKCCSAGDEKCCFKIIYQVNSAKDSKISLIDNNIELCPILEKSVKFCKICNSDYDCKKGQTCCKAFNKRCCFYNLRSKKHQHIKEISTVKHYINPEHCPKLETELLFCKECKSNANCKNGQLCCQEFDKRCCYEDTHTEKKNGSKHLKIYNNPNCPIISIKVHKCKHCDTDEDCDIREEICCSSGSKHSCCYKKPNIQHKKDVAMVIPINIPEVSTRKNLKSTTKVKTTTTAPTTRRTTTPKTTTSTTTLATTTSMRKRTPRTKWTKKIAASPFHIHDGKEALISGRECPLFPVASEWCRNCSTDWDCATGHKCCEIVNQHCCTYIIRQEPIIVTESIGNNDIYNFNTAFCPVAQFPLKKCKKCSDDDDCPPNQKCCNVFGKMCCRKAISTSSGLSVEVTDVTCPIIKMHVPRCKMCIEEDDCANGEICCDALDQKCCSRPMVIESSDALPTIPTMTTKRLSLTYKPDNTITAVGHKTYGLIAGTRDREGCSKEYTGYCYRCRYDSECSDGKICCPNHGRPCCFAPLVE